MYCWLKTGPLSEPEVRSFLANPNDPFLIPDGTKVSLLIKVEFEQKTNSGKCTKHMYRSCVQGHDYEGVKITKYIKQRGKDTINSYFTKKFGKK